MVERVFHGAGLGTPGVEEHQHQVGEVHDVVGHAQNGAALGVGVEAGRVDEDHALERLTGAGLELDVGVDAPPLALLDLLQLLAHLVERVAQVRVQGHARQHAALLVAGVADDRELVVQGVGAGALQRVLQTVVDER